MPYFKLWTNTTTNTGIVLKQHRNLQSDMHTQVSLSCAMPSILDDVQKNVSTCVQEGKCKTMEDAMGDTHILCRTFYMIKDYETLMWETMHIAP